MARTQQRPTVKNITNERIVIEWPDGSGMEVDREMLARLVTEEDEIPGHELANVAVSLALQGIDVRGNSLALKQAIESSRVWKK